MLPSKKAFVGRLCGASNTNNQSSQGDWIEGEFVEPDIAHKMSQQHLNNQMKLNALLNWLGSENPLGRHVDCQA